MTKQTFSFDFGTRNFRLSGLFHGQLVIG